ncbi:MAG: CRISPR-associated endonuclease Cas1 [Roseovarius sp.]|nr:CRISPR-associated endonuclease Cas1 [Alphaproteobacteria bacterium]MCY4207974.1 CRISPR-associated endonuclease Cas1 [Roseovarius sp.]
MRHLSTAYIRDHAARISHRRGSLHVNLSESMHRIPLESIDALILMGGAQITTQALDACVRRGVRVAALRSNGAVRFVVSGPTSGNVHLRLAQHRAASDCNQALEISKTIVAAKLQSSRKVLERWSRDAKDDAQAEWLAARAGRIGQRVMQLGHASTGDKVRGIEGDAARIHFGALGKVIEPGEFAFSARSRRPPRDPVNAMLGFCYAMLVTECIGAAESVGLDYQIGFLHRPRSGRPSLALDLAEELRAVTDRFVVSSVRRRQVSPDDFVSTPGGGVYLSDDGRKRLIARWEEHKEASLQHQLLGKRVGRWAVPSIQATLLARHLRADLPAYPPFVLS